MTLQVDWLSNSEYRPGALKAQVTQGNNTVYLGVSQPDPRYPTHGYTWVAGLDSDRDFSGVAPSQERAQELAAQAARHILALLMLEAAVE